MGLIDKAKNLARRLLGERDPLGPEIGFGGASIFGGVVLDEHDPKLSGLNGVRKAAEMRRSDATVASTEKVVSLPIRSTVWMIEEPDNPSAAEKEAAELLRENLFGGMETSWDDLLREGCLAIYYGFRVPEVVWEERAGLIAIKKVASRNPELIERWLFNADGSLAGYLYAGNRPVGNGIQDWNYSSTKFERIPIPIERVIHFCYDQENDNPHGKGMWRPMHPHWYYKQGFYKILAIGVERNLLDIPVGYLQKSATDADKKAFLRQLTRWRAAENAALVLPDGQKLDFQGSSRALLDALPIILHHDAKMSQCGLGQFLNLGQGAHGTQALAAEQVKIFETSEDANARWIEQAVNQQLVRPWVLLNYGTGVRAPKVTHKPIRSIDLQSWGQALSSFISGGLLHAGPDDEEYIRDTMELPSIPEDQLKVLKERAKQERLAPPQKSAATDPSAEPVKARERIDCDLHRFSDDDAAALRKARDEKEKTFADQARERLQAMQEGYLAALKPLIEQVEGADKISQGVPLNDIAGVAVPGTAKYEQFIRSYLWEVFNEGRAALSEETGQAADGPVPNKTRSWINAKAKVMAADHAGQLQSAVLNRVLTGVHAQLPASQIFSDAGAVAIQELSANAIRDFGATAAEIVAQVSEVLG